MQKLNIFYTSGTGVVNSLSQDIHIYGALAKISLSTLKWDLSFK